jgi:hypothetical protein
VVETSVSETHNCYDSAPAMGNILMWLRLRVRPHSNASQNFVKEEKFILGLQVFYLLVLHRYIMTIFESIVGTGEKFVYLEFS